MNKIFSAAILATTAFCLPCLAFTEKEWDAEVQASTEGVLAIQCSVWPEIIRFAKNEKPDYVNRLSDMVGRSISLGERVYGARMFREKQLQYVIYEMESVYPMRKSHDMQAVEGIIRIHEKLLAQCDILINHSLRKLGSK